MQRSADLPIRPKSYNLLNVAGLSADRKNSAARRMLVQSYFVAAAGALAGADAVVVAGAAGVEPVDAGVAVVDDFFDFFLLLCGVGLAVVVEAESAFAESIFAASAAFGAAGAAAGAAVVAAGVLPWANAVAAKPAAISATRSLFILSGVLELKSWKNAGVYLRPVP